MPFNLGLSDVQENHRSDVVSSATRYGEVSYRDCDLVYVVNVVARFLLCKLLAFSL